MVDTQSPWCWLLVRAVVLHRRAWGRPPGL